MKHRLPGNPVLSVNHTTKMTLRIEQLGLTPYHLAHERQMQLIEKLHRDENEDDVCLMLEHPPVFTLGRNASSEHITVSKSFLARRGIELIKVERGGEVTYHGPGQLICYPIINLRKKKVA